MLYTYISELLTYYMELYEAKSQYDTAIICRIILNLITNLSYPFKIFKKDDFIKKGGALRFMQVYTWVKTVLKYTPKHVFNHDAKITPKQGFCGILP